MKSKRSLLFMFVSVSLLTLLSISALIRAQDTTEEPANEYGEMSGMSHETPMSAEAARLVADVRQGTAGFRDFAGIQDAGYGKFLDCFTNNQVGAMGQHYVNGDLAGDDVVDPLKPEALVYEPTENGQMNLVAFEYLVFANVWDPDNTGREAPTLFDHPFHLITTVPNTPPFWALHLWLWTDNPNGLFSDFNPIVFCPADQPITDMTPAS
jgi:hypothetical protein